ncbi:hypothetical protein Golob_018478 [Gossypium lobatum]|uniref:Protein kinase domain-containing protein n=1 Tax=Gossypium lobatum TaxID=34289 RepID=A0A7J8MAF5_9ROSI|nr:hypothetical protein [Gossypium lobatum]
MSLTFLCLGDYIPIANSVTTPGMHLIRAINQIKSSLFGIRWLCRRRIFFINYEASRVKRKLSWTKPKLLWINGQNYHLDERNSNALANWRQISYQELRQATNGFCVSNLLGAGCFGSVYQGTLSEGLNVAIEVFNLELEGAFKSFEVECEALVLEFMPDGSLEKWLYSHNYFLVILQRLITMIDAASALEYLHHSQTIPIAHCDLKPSNVVLDEHMVARLGDFGLAK